MSILNKWDRCHWYTSILNVLSIHLQFLNYLVFIIISWLGLVGMIEKALNMLGVDDDELTKLMSDLGRKHVLYGGKWLTEIIRVVRLKIHYLIFWFVVQTTVKADYFPHMKEAIKAMLHEMLEMKFDSRDEDAWDASVHAWEDSWQLRF